LIVSSHFRTPRLFSLCQTLAAVGAIPHWGIYPGLTIGASVYIDRARSRDNLGLGISCFGRFRPQQNRGTSQAEGGMLASHPDLN
jgi:hypothetical protein